MSKVTVGDLIDALTKADAAIDKINATLAVAKEAYKKIELELIDALRAQKVEGGKGKHKTASIKNAKHWKIENWLRFTAYVHKKKAYELFQKRISVTALDERMTAGEKVPGIESFTTVSISLTARSK